LELQIAVAVLVARACSNTDVGVGGRRKRLAPPLQLFATSQSSRHYYNTVHTPSLARSLPFFPFPPSTSPPSLDPFTFSICKDSNIAPLAVCGPGHAHHLGLSTPPSVIDSVIGTYLGFTVQYIAANTHLFLPPLTQPTDLTLCTVLGIILPTVPYIVAQTPSAGSKSRSFIPCLIGRSRDSSH
jgi:hypothetical protein